MIRRGELAVAYQAGWIILAHVDDDCLVSIATYANGGGLDRFGWFAQGDNEVISHRHWLEDESRNFATIRRGVARRSLRHLSDDKVLYLMGFYTPLHKRLLWIAQDVLRKMSGTYE